ncbi:MAG: sugar ABC transporter permease [Lachnospiraceae bacterium]|jgi:multiple sugar transport system permease protein|nr:sugar ABC transporter permease [Lachnospiraceae bacterium]
MKGKRKTLTIQQRNNIWGFAFILPCILIFAIFTIYPFFYSAYLSMQAKSGSSMTDFTFAGFSQFVRAFQSKEMWNSFLVTAIYTFPTVALHLIFGLGLAVLVNKSIHFRPLVRAMYFVPVILSTVVVSMVWKFMLSPKVGLFNQFLALFGITPDIAWLKSPRLAMAAIIIVGVWKWIGYFMVLYLAALQDIPVTLYEAARIDGASARQSFFKITVPLLANTTQFLLVISVINTFQVFDQIFMLTGGGPVKKTDVIVYYIYRQAFKNYDMPYASAVSWLLFVVIFILTAIQMKLSKNSETY